MLSLICYIHDKAVVTREIRTVEEGRRLAKDAYTDCVVKGAFPSFEIKSGEDLLEIGSAKTSGWRLRWTRFKGLA